MVKEHDWHKQYAPAGAEYGDWHVDGIIVPKDAESIPSGATQSGLTDTKIPKVTMPDDVEKNSDGIYHNAGVLLYDQDGDNDFNDLVVDFDAEARFPADGNYPYIKLVMHLRAISSTTINEVDWRPRLLDQYVCPADDMHITIQGVNIDHTPEVLIPGESTALDFRSVGITVSDLYQQGAEAGSLQWLRTGADLNGYFPKDANGHYNVTQASFSDKPFATVEVTYYPRESATGEDIEQAVANIISVVSQDFSFYASDGTKLTSGEYIVAPVGTSHPVEGATIQEAFPLYGTSTDWWKAENQDADKVVDINRGYQW